MRGKNYHSWIIPPLCLFACVDVCKKRIWREYELFERFRACMLWKCTENHCTLIFSVTPLCVCVNFLLLTNEVRRRGCVCMCISLCFLDINTHECWDSRFPGLFTICRGSFFSKKPCVRASGGAGCWEVCAWAPAFVPRRWLMPAAFTTLRKSSVRLTGPPRSGSLTWQKTQWEGKQQQRHLQRTPALAKNSHLGMV